jgi:hypothetical protein
MYKTYFTGEITLHVAQIVNTLHNVNNKGNNSNKYHAMKTCATI